MAYLPVRGDNPLAEARGLSPVQVDNNGMTYISMDLAHYEIVRHFNATFYATR